MNIIAALSRLAGAASRLLLERAAVMGEELMLLAARFRAAVLLSAAALLFIWSSLLFLSLTLVLVTRDELRPLIGLLISLTHLCAGLILVLLAQRRFHQVRRPLLLTRIRPDARGMHAPGQD